jgi:hypothetical protein
VNNTLSINGFTCFVVQGSNGSCVLLHYWVFMRDERLQGTERYLVLDMAGVGSYQDDDDRRVHKDVSVRKHA